MNLKNLNLSLCALSVALGISLISAPANAQTGKPDLTVTNVGVLESEDQIGAEAHLIARVENCGAVATKKDVAHAVAFYVDGTFVAWADTYRQDLKPGQFAIVRTNGGPYGKATWKIAPGKHTIRAVVDDVSRIDESDEENNAFEKTLSWGNLVTMLPVDRPEFADVSPGIYNRLITMENAGLFEAAHGTKLPPMPLARYEVAVLLTYVQEKFPDLTGDKAQRLRALTTATATAKTKLTSVEIENLGDDIGFLQNEFRDELKMINSRGSFIDARNINVEPKIIAPPRASQRRQRRRGGAGVVQRGRRALVLGLRCADTPAPRVSPRRVPQPGPARRRRRR